MNKKVFIKLSITIVITIIIITFIGSIRCSSNEKFSITKNTASVKKTNTSALTEVQGKEDITFIKPKSSPSPTPSPSPSPSPAPYSLFPSYILTSNTPASLLQPEQSRMNYLNTTSTDTQIQIPLYKEISQQPSVEQPKINLMGTSDVISTIGTSDAIGTIETTDATSTINAANIYDNAINFFSPSS
jgi:hypothetical protein